MKKSKSGSYVRMGLAVELVLDRDDEYDDVAEKASEELQVPDVPDEHHLTLLMSGRAVIPAK